MSSFSYDDAAGQRHEILVRRTAAGDWEVLDTFASDTQVIETLDGHVDAEPQAEAVARDYLAAGRFLLAPGRGPDEAIPQDGGADAHRDRRPHSAARP